MYSQNSILGDACFNKCFELVKYLVEHGADVNTGKDAGMRTPLFWAAWGMDKKNNDLKIVKYLVENGAEINTQTKYDGTPLHSAYMWEKNINIYYLIEKGADLNATDSKGQSVLHKAVIKKDIKSAKLFYDKGADPYLKDNSGKSPKEYAKENKLNELVAL